MAEGNLLFLCEKKEKVDLVDFNHRNRPALEVVYLVVNFLNFLCEKKEKLYDLVYVVDIVDAKRKPP